MISNNVIINLYHSYQRWGKFWKRNVRITRIFKKDIILYSHQYGFQNNHSRNQVFISFTEKIKNGFYNDKFACTLHVDLQKALGTVDQDILLSKMEQYGVRDVPVSLFLKHTWERENNTLQILWCTSGFSIRTPSFFNLH